MSALLAEPYAAPDRPETISGPLEVEFDGRAGEWFGIWIVNLMLTIVTFGIYSAWAKVRRKKYFHQHTRIAGRSFDYHATGGQILVGRLIVLAGVIVYSLLAAMPVLAVVMPLLLIALIPFLAVRALRFNARMTSWAKCASASTAACGGLFSFITSTQDLQLSRFSRSIHLRRGRHSAT